MITDKPNTYTGKRGLVSERILSFADGERFEDQKLSNMIDYIMTTEEQASIPRQAMEGQMVSFGVGEMIFAAGRYKIRGKISAEDIAKYPAKK